MVSESLLLVLVLLWLTVLPRNPPSPPLLVYCCFSLLLLLLVQLLPPLLLALSIDSGALPRCCSWPCFGPAAAVWSNRHVTLSQRWE